MSELALKLIAENKKTRAPFLDLGNCGLSEIPAELAELEWLEALSFASRWYEFDGREWHQRESRNTGPKNRLTSVSGMAVVSGNLSRLKKLWICGSYDNVFEFTDLKPLAGLTCLRRLDVSWTQVNDLSPLAGLIDLRRLDVSRTQVSDLSPLAGLIGLQRLDVYGSQVSDLSPLAGLTELQQLDVSSSQVSDLSPLAGLIGLQWLNVSSTETRNLSPLAGLTSLQQLIVSDCSWIVDLGPLAGLTGLQRLDVSRSQVRDLSPLAGLTDLQQINVSRSQVSDLRPLAGLICLQRLTVSGCQVSDLSPLAGLTDLQQINVSRSQVSDLRPLARMAGLQRLTVSGSQVSDLSPLAGLTGLHQLTLSRSQVSDLSSIVKLISQGLPVKWDHKSWEGDGIYLQDCPLTNPPVEVVKQGNAAILNYFREQESQGVDHLYEAKLLIIGEGGAGKTSLLRRLYQTDQPLPDEKDSTKGIDIYRHEFTLKNGRSFRLNVWDFGGQQIYHATHQFFLTKRSLYVLLDDTRKDDKSVHDEGFKYWLEVVDWLGGHSPILVFQNEKAGRSKTIDQAGIKGRFDNVKDFYRGNLLEIDAANSLREAIEFYVQKLPHIGEALPAKWVVIREDIEALAEQKPVILLQEYFDIYGKHLPFDRSKALFLSDYLHDLGVFLHFQDEPWLARTVILQNQWATEAVFKILDDEIVKSNWGHFDSEDCRRLWQDSVYAGMHPELLALMQKFELCYPLPDTAQSMWLAPQLLPPSRPDGLQFISQAGDLVLRFCYPFLPKGMISRLIVRMHRFIQHPELCWNSGALFQQRDSAVLAEIPAEGGEIVLRARGTERKELLSVIAADLDALNATFHGLSDKIDKRVPCTCIRCRQLAEPEFFQQKRLLQRKNDGKLTIECPSSYEDVSVLQLLDGIEVKALPAWAEDKSKEAKAGLETETSERTIKVFLASSSELKEDRDAFDLYFRQQNDQFRKRGIYLEIIRWENFLDAMSKTRFQDEYNQAAKNCDIFVSLFFTKTGEFTEEEFDSAYNQFKAIGKPHIYTYFKDMTGTKPSRENREDFQSLWNFQDKLSELGHFYREYKNIDDLKRQFRDQLEKLMHSA